MSNQKSKSAFPYQHNNGFHESGMSMRDYFAAKALPVAAEVSKCSSGFVDESNYHDLAKHAYAIADAMLEARSK